MIKIIMLLIIILLNVYNNVESILNDEDGRTQYLKCSNNNNNMMNNIKKMININPEDRSGFYTTLLKVMGKQKKNYDVPICLTSNNFDDDYSVIFNDKIIDDEYEDKGIDVYYKDKYKLFKNN